MRCLAAPALLLPLLLLGAAPLAVARADDATTPVGRWKTIDDESKKPKSIVLIYEEDGKLYGKIEKLLDPKPDDPDPVCKKCEGELKDKPVLGLRMMWNFKKDGSGVGYQKHGTPGFQKHAPSGPSGVT